MKKKLLFIICLITTLSLVGQNSKARFQPSSNPETFGFDSMLYAEADFSYPQVKIIGGKYADDSWVSVECGKETRVNLVFSKLILGTDIKLMDMMGQEAICIEKSSSAFSYKIVGKSKGSEDFYFLTEKKTKVTDTLAGLAVVSYPLEKLKIVLVPIGNVSISAEYSKNLQDQLNAIYRQAVAEYEVTMASSFNSPNLDNGIEIIDNDKYSDAMKVIVDAYKKSQKPEKNVTYIFILEKSKSDLNYLMPKGKSFGFCTIQTTPRNIAHMLGHGIFKLDNIYSIISKPRGSTDNLMDDGAGIKLIKSQWDKIH